MAVGDRYTVTLVDNLYGRVKLDAVVSDSVQDACGQSQAALPTQDQPGYENTTSNAPGYLAHTVQGQVAQSGGEAVDQNSLSGLGQYGLSGGVQGPNAFPVVPPAFPAAPGGAGIVNGTR
jgi:hypothetical protein